MKLSEYRVKRCSTVSGWLLKDNKILLVKHKMLGIWLAPGGHVDANELPHQAAEREVFEETGIKVRAIDAHPTFSAKAGTEALPMPFMSNVHWINKPGEHKARPDGTVCEQHYIFAYFVECAGECVLDDSDEGIDAVRWFSRNEIASLATNDEIKQEALFVFEHYPKI